MQNAILSPVGCRIVTSLKECGLDPRLITRGVGVQEMIYLLQRADFVSEFSYRWDENSEGPFSDDLARFLSFFDDATAAMVYAELPNEDRAAIQKVQELLCARANLCVLHWAQLLVSVDFFMSRPEDVPGIFEFSYSGAQVIKATRELSHVFTSL